VVKTWTGISVHGGHMIETVVECVGDIRIYGKGMLGGKGDGLVQINEYKIPGAHKLRTLILATGFYDRFLDNEGIIPKVDQKTIASILEDFRSLPISVRSSATNEASVLAGGDDSVHAGENTSFMLPNNHSDVAIRGQQLFQAITFIYNDFRSKQALDSREKMAIVINPIPGTFLKTDAGPIYFPLVSGVANSYFPHALQSQKPDEGFARLAFGHGYATVMDDFPVISMATIKDPLPGKLLGSGQQYFYAINMHKNQGLSGEELETMKRINIRFADIRVLKKIGFSKNKVTLDYLIQEDGFGFRSGLQKIMDFIASEIVSNFQIEFVFNTESGDGQNGKGTFHVVQLTRLPAISRKKIKVPKDKGRVYLSISNIQGQGIKRDIRYAVVVSPFLYRKEVHDEVKEQITLLTQKLRRDNQKYVIIVPGRLGSTNRDWGIQVEFRDIGKPEAIFEYGVDIAGRAEPIKDPLTGGGIYGSHFLYMIQGGYNEEKKQIKTRMFGTQGTHFLTNLMSNNIVYGFVIPVKDVFDPWFFSPPDQKAPVYLLTFPHPVIIYADSFTKRCIMIPAEGKLNE